MINIKNLTVPNNVDDAILICYCQLVLNKIYERFSMLVYNYYNKGQQTYITLKNMIQQLLVNLRIRIISFKDRLLESYPYQPYTQWNTGNFNNLKPCSFDENKKCKSLSNSMTHEQRLNLSNSNHDSSMYNNNNILNPEHSIHDYQIWWKNKWMTIWRH